MEIKEGYFRVSDVLRPWVDFSHINPVVLANKARIGTNVHEKIACDHDDIFLDLTDEEVGYYNSWLEWREKNPVKILESERRLYSDAFKITGCIDALLEMEGRRVVVDFKTSASANLKAWALQGGMYHMLATENKYHPGEAFWFLQLKKDGKVAKLHEFFMDQALLETCQGAIRVYAHFNC